MADDSTAQNGVSEAKGILRDMVDGATGPLVQLRRRVEDLMATLDLVLGVLPDDTADEILGSIEQIVTNLHNADLALRGSGEAEALRSLALAERRILRLRDALASLAG